MGILRKPPANKRNARKSKGGNRKTQHSAPEKTGTLRQRNIKRKTGMAANVRKPLRPKPDDETSSAVPPGDGGSNGRDNGGNRFAVVRRAARVFARVGGFVIVLAAVVFGAWNLYKYVTSSAYFAVQFVETTGNTRMSNAKVLEVAEFSVGDNIFDLQPEVLENRIEKEPWVVEAHVQKKLPHTVQIQLVERVEELLVLFDTPYLVDDTGHIFKRWVHGDPSPSTIVTGIPEDLVNSDPKEVEAILLDAIALRESYINAGANRYAALNEIHVEADDDFSLTLGKDPFYLKLGARPYRRKLQRLTKLLALFSRTAKRPSIIYFDNEKRPDRATVKFKPEKKNK